MTDETFDSIPETPEFTEETGHDMPQDEKPSSPLHEFLTHQRVAAEEAGKALSALIPPDFRTHGKAAKEAWLMSFKVLIEGTAEMVDHELSKMQARNTDEEKPSGPSTTGKTKVKVEVS